LEQVSKATENLASSNTSKNCIDAGCLLRKIIFLPC